MQRDDYDMKFQNMIDDGIIQSIYCPSVDATLNDMKRIQNFLHRTFKGKYDRYEDKRLVSKQLDKICATTKTHKCDSLKDITIQNLKFRPIVS